MYNKLNKTLEALNMTLKDIVVEYRTEHNLSQRQFALQCGLSNGYISMLEKEINPSTGSKITPTLPALNKLAAGMNMTLNELFTIVDDMEVDMKMPTPNTEGGHSSVDGEIIALLASLSDTKKQQALKFLHFLAADSDS